MKTNLIISVLLIMTIFVSCKKEPQPLITNDPERILRITQNYYIDPYYGSYSDYKLILDTTQLTFQKRNGIDSSFSPLPDVDTTFDISNQQWDSLLLSFNMDSVMALDTFYSPIGADAAWITLEILSTQRYKKISYSITHFPPIEKTYVLRPIDSLNKLLIRMRDGLW